MKKKTKRLVKKLLGGLLLLGVLSALAYFYFSGMLQGAV